MAVKKASTPKTSSTPKAAATKKVAATKKAAITKKAPAKKAPAKKAPARKASAVPTKKAVVKKAAPIKLSDSQTRVLVAVQQAPEAGYAAGKGEGKVLESLLKKKLVKRGKKVDGSARYLATKAGAKHMPTPSVPSVASTPAIEPVVAPSVVAPA